MRNIYIYIYYIQPREIFLPCVQYLSKFHAERWNIYWRANEASETLSGVTQSRFRCIYLFTYLFIWYVGHIFSPVLLNTSWQRVSRNPAAKRLLCRIQYPVTGAFYLSEKVCALSEQEPLKVFSV